MSFRRPANLAPAGIIYAAGALLCLVFLGKLEAPMEFFSAPFPGRILLAYDPQTAVLYGVVCGTALSLTSQLLTRFTQWGKLLSDELAGVVGHLHPADVFLLAALSSFSEEVLFRAILLPYLGLFVSSLLFGCAHLIPKKGLWGWSVWALAAGVIFGLLAEATGGILAPVAAHFTVNLTGLFLLSRRVAG